MARGTLGRSARDLPDRMPSDKNDGAAVMVVRQVLFQKVGVRMKVVGWFFSMALFVSSAELQAWTGEPPVDAAGMGARHQGVLNYDPPCADQMKTTNLCVRSRHADSGKIQVDIYFRLYKHYVQPRFPQGFPSQEEVLKVFLNFERWDDYFPRDADGSYKGAIKSFNVTMTYKTEPTAWEHLASYMLKPTGVAKLAYPGGIPVEGLTRYERLAAAVSPAMTSMHFKVLDFIPETDKTRAGKPKGALSQVGELHAVPEHCDDRPNADSWMINYTTEIGLSPTLSTLAPELSRSIIRGGILDILVSMFDPKNCLNKPAPGSDGSEQEDMENCSDARLE